jgi:hypothetical protein
MKTCNRKDKKHKDYIYNQIKVNREKTLQKKYGKSSFTETDIFKEKTKKTLLKKYGVDNIFKLKKIQDKIKKTNINRYGEEYPAAAVKKLKDIDFTEYLDSNKNIKLTSIKKDFKCSTDTVYRELRKQKIEYNKLSGSSHNEQEIIKFIKGLVPDASIIINSRKIISPYELDIYLPEYNLAIEYNGLMFHSSGISKYPLFNNPDFDKNYHLKKTKACEEKGIHLLHIQDNEWLNPKLREIWKSIIANKLHKITNKIGARKLSFAQKEQLLKESKTFLEENHLQGSGAIGSIRYGLIHNGELLALMTFSKARFSGADYELVRFTVKKNWSIPGAASKLLKAFQKEYPNKKIISYANRRWSNGNLYKALGFQLVNISPPNFYVFHPKNIFKLWHRVSFQKHKLKNKLELFDKKLTSEENLFINGYRKVYDSGNFVYRLG